MFRIVVPSLVDSTENVVPSTIVVEYVPVVGVKLKGSVVPLISAIVVDDSANRAKQFKSTYKYGIGNWI